METRLNLIPALRSILATEPGPGWIQYGSAPKIRTRYGRAFDLHARILRRAWSRGITEPAFLYGYDFSTPEA